MTLSRPVSARRAPWWAKSFSVAHVALYRATGGVIGHWLGTQRALLLTTTGRKSGQSRTQALSYFALEEPAGTLALVASNWGRDTPPAWHLNLLAQPSAHVQLKGETFPVTARVATAAERARLWPRVAASNPQYTRYQAGTARAIPIVLLRRDG